MASRICLTVTAASTLAATLCAALATASALGACSAMGWAIPAAGELRSAAWTCAGIAWTAVLAQAAARALDL